MKKQGRKYEFGVCSRNMRLDKPNNSSWWKIAKQINAEHVLKDIAKIDNATTVVLQGEIIGNGIQGNKYCVNLDFYAFNLIIDNRKQDQRSLEAILSSYSIKTVPYIGETILSGTIQDMVEKARGKSILKNIDREGLVLRNYEKDISFKIINPDFLLKEKD